MSNPAILFVSHSTRDDARAAGIAAALDATGRVRAVIDNDHLRDGQSWRNQLYRWIARCDAGLVLLTPEVMERPGWVLQEATLLRARKAHEGERFPLFVHIEDTPGRTKVREHERWAGFFEPLQLSELQRGRHQDDAALAVAVADECDRQGLAGRTDLFSLMKSQFEPVLAPLLQHNAAARAIVAQLEDTDAHWERIVGHDAAPAATLAQRLCDAREDTRIGHFEGLDSMFQFLHGQLRGQALDGLLSLMKPYWVYFGAALQVAGALSRPPGRRLAALPTGKPALAPLLHLERVLGPYNRMPTLFTLGAGNDSLAELENQFVTQWNDRFDPDRDDPVADLPEIAERAVLLNVAQVAVLPRQTVPDLALAFAARCPPLGLVVPVAPGTPLDAPAWRDFVVVDPVRAPAVERALAQQYHEARARISA